MKRIILLFLLILIIVSCRFPHKAISTEPSMEIHGFFGGIHHGFKCVFSLVFCGNMYDTYNSGSWYDVGFLIGEILFVMVLAIIGFLIYGVTKSIKLEKEEKEREEYY